MQQGSEEGGSSSGSSTSTTPLTDRPPVEAAAAAPEAAYGCKHYKRRCRLLSPCCGEWFACRFCHDDVKCGETAAGHKMDRHLVTKVQCTGCGTEQPPNRECVACGLVLGQYFCGECNLFDDDVSKQQFHCDKCGICRVGARAHAGRLRCCPSLPNSPHPAREREGGASPVAHRPARRGRRRARKLLPLRHVRRLLLQRPQGQPRLREQLDARPVPRLLRLPF